MIEIELSEDMVDECRPKANAIGRLNNSVTDGDGNLAGVVGEYVVHKYLNGSTWENTFDYDLIYRDKKIDVKTKRTSVIPMPYYECSIYDQSTHQECDGYVFVRLMKDMSKAWILGGLSKEEYFKNALHHKEGEVDTDNDFTYPADCYNISISKLKQFKK